MHDIGGIRQAAVMGDGEDRELFAQAAQRFDDGGLTLWIKRARGLVKDQKLRFVDEGAGDGDPLTLTAR